MHTGDTQPTHVHVVTEETTETYRVRQVPDDETRLAAWYEQMNRADMHMALEKRQDYGSADITLMAAGMRILASAPPWEPDERQAMEMALGFYQLGKVARKFGAWAQGKDPNIDSDVDLGVYAMMARRVREAGQW